MARTPAGLVDFVRFFDRLSALPRTGWLLRGVTDAESIAEHSFGVALVTMLLVDEARARGVEIDGERALRMALLHDAAEAFTGDVPMPAKTAALRAALSDAEGDLLASELSAPELALWREAEACESLEARVVKAADKLQMLVKALIYEDQGRGRLDAFWQNTQNRMHMDLDFPKAVFAEIERRAAEARARGKSP